MVYISIYIYCIIFSLLVMTKQFYKHRAIILFSIGIILILLAGLRFNIGYDYTSYENIFNNSPDLYSIITYGNTTGVELGYILINSIVKTIGGNFNLVLFISACISIIVLVKSVNEYSVYPVLSILIYISRFYFVRDMGQIRSAIACAIMIYSIKFISKRRFKEFTITTIIACSFHSVAILGFLLYFFNSIKFKNYKYVYKVLGISIIISQLKFTDILLKIVSELLPKYSTYINSEYYTSTNNLINPVTLMQILIILIFVYFNKQIDNKDNNYRVILNGYLISTAILIIFSNYYTLAGRLSTMFATFEILIIPMLIKYIFKNKDRIIIYIIIILYAILIFYFIFWQKSSHIYIPYKSIIMS